MEEYPLQGHRFFCAVRYLARVVCDVQAASILASRGIAIREKSAVRPFSIEFDPVGLPTGSFGKDNTTQPFLAILSVVRHASPAAASLL